MSGVPKGSAPAPKAGACATPTDRPMWDPTPQGEDSPMTSTSTITLQQATAAEDAALRELSQLDSARTVRRPALMAIVDDRLIAAVSLRDGRIVADPFAETEDAVALLRLRAPSPRRRSSGSGWRRGPRRSLRPRAAV
jgi:hypothetical protein